MIALLLAVWCGVGELSAQQEGLEQSPQYIALRSQEKLLLGQQDSILRVIDQIRHLFAQEPTKRDSLGEEILRLESDLYEVRSQIGVAASSIATLEQEAVLSRLTGESDPSPQPQAGQVTELIANQAFREELSEADYQTLSQMQQLEVELAPLLAQYQQNYLLLDELATRYVEGERSEAEEAFTQLRTLKGINRALSDSIGSMWERIFDNKFYLYALLFDKTNHPEELERMEQALQATSEELAAQQGTLESEALYTYRMGKELIIDCEAALAAQWGYTLAQDSLRLVLESLQAESYRLAKIEPAQRNFIPYAPILVGPPSIYNAKNPIPDFENFDIGTVYRIHVGSFSHKQSISIFRNVSPIVVEKSPENRYSYYVGACRTWDDAVAAWEQLDRLGFRKPIIVVWRDGVFEEIGTPEEVAEEGAIFRVEIPQEADVISPEAEAVLQRVAPHKELSRSLNPEGGFLYTVGSFALRSEAETLRNELEIEGITCSIKEILTGAPLSE